MGLMGTSGRARRKPRPGFLVAKRENATLYLELSDSVSANWL